MLIGVGSGCDEDSVMPVGTSTPFLFSEIGRSFSCVAGGSTMVCDEGGVMPIGVSASSTFLFFLVSVLWWIVPFGVTFLTLSCSLMSGPASVVFGGEVLELMVDQCNGMDEDEERVKWLCARWGQGRKSIWAAAKKRCTIVWDMKSDYLKIEVGRAGSGILITNNIFDATARVV